MEFNTTFARNANIAFSSNDGCLCNGSLIRELSLENNNLFNRYLITKIGSDEVDVPIIAREHIEQVIANSMSPLTGISSVKTVVLPLYENNLPQNRRTFDSFINQFFTNMSYARRLMKITSNKGEVYYGGKGLIFDSGYNPLLLCTLRARKIQIGPDFKMEYIKPVIYVSPIVFMESDKLVNKGIVKKIIPYYTSRGVTLPYPSYMVFYLKDIVRMDGKKATVIIDNLDKFFVKPVVPKPQRCTTKSLNECLVNNIEDILAII